MYIFKKSTKRTVAAICTMLLVICMSLSPFTSITAEAAMIVRNIVEKVNITFTDGVADWIQFKGVDIPYLKAKAEAEYRAAYLRKEIENKAAWDEMQAAKKEADDSYEIQEYEGSTYVPLDFGDDDTLWDNIRDDLENIEGFVVGAQFDEEGAYVIEDGQQVQNTKVKITFIVQRSAAQNNGGSTGGSNKSSSDVSNENSSDEPAHTHNYELKTITEATAEQDGLEAYVCTICGAYGESVSVPASAYNFACTDAAGKVLTAKQNDTLVLEMGRWNSYPKWFMENLASRSDLTIKIRFEYQNKQYELTIPAGTKIETECDWYGPLKLCSLYEYTVK